MHLLAGFGAGLVFMIIPVFINQYFDKYRGLALGITYTGSASSALIFPKLLLFLKETYNFKWSVRIFGAILIHVTAVTLVLKEPTWIKQQRLREARLAMAQKAGAIYSIERSNETASAKNAKEGTRNGPKPGSLRHGLTVLRCPMFFVTLCTYLVFGYIFDIFMSTIVDFARDRGASVSDAVALIPLFSITDTLGRLCLPVLADRGYVRRSTLATFNYLVMGIVLFMLPAIGSYQSLLAVCLILGVFIGCGVTSYPVLMAEYIGLQRLPISYGLVGTIAGPLFVPKPFLIGYFRDTVGSYDNMYRLLGCGLIVIGLLWLVVACSEHRKTKLWHVDDGGRCTRSVAAHSYYCQPVLGMYSCTEIDDAPPAGVERPSAG